MDNNYDNRKFIYQIDSDDLIVFINEDWLMFAKENEAEHLSQENILKKQLWDYVSNRETTFIYKMALEEVRKKQKVINFPFRCDSANCRRFMEMEIKPHQQNEVIFISRMLKLEYRDPVDLLLTNIKRSNEFVSICSWCKKVKVGSHYEEIESAIIKLDLFNNEKLPQLTHGICPDCVVNFAKRVKKV